MKLYALLNAQNTFTTDILNPRDERAALLSVLFIPRRVAVLLQSVLIASFTRHGHQKQNERASDGSRNKRGPFRQHSRHAGDV